MPFPLLVPAILSGASFLGGLFGNRNRQTSSIDPSLIPLRNAILPSIISRIRNPVQFGQDYTTTGIAGINRSFDSAEQGLANRLSARGLSSSPIAGAGLSKLFGARAGAIGEFKAQIPLLEREMQNQDLYMALNALYGGGSNVTQTSGGGVGGGISGLAQMLGFLYGMKGLGGAGGQNVMDTSFG